MSVSPVVLKGQLNNILIYILWSRAIGGVKQEKRRTMRDLIYIEEGFLQDYKKKTYLSTVLNNVV